MLMKVFFDPTIKLIRSVWFQLILLFKNLKNFKNSFGDNHRRQSYHDRSTTKSRSNKQMNNHQNNNNNYGSAIIKEDQQVCLSIPQPKGLPIVGTFFDLIAAGAAPKLHKYIDKRHRELGPIFRERLGGTQDAVFVASASLMRSVFLYEGQHPRHPLPVAWTLYNKKHNCQRGLFFMEGSEWQYNRRVLNRFMVNGNLNWLDSHIERCTEKLINIWKQEAFKALETTSSGYYEIRDLEPQLYRWAIDVICSIMFGSIKTTNTQLEVALNEFSQIVHKIFENSSTLMNFPPQVAQLLHLKIWTQFEQSVSDVLLSGSRIIDMFVAMQEAEGDVVDDFNTDALFHKLRDAEMPTEMIKRIFVDLVIAAGDTTAYTTEWALYLLSQDYQLQHSMTKSFRTEGQNMPQVHGLIKETLRLYPVAPFIGRYLDCDANLGGYQIKKDTLVLLSLYTAGRDPAHFPDPLAVKPERWQRCPETGELQQVLRAHGTLPFAIGNRSCIGRKVATNQIHNLLAAMADNFYLKCNNTSEIDCLLRMVTVPSQPIQLAIKLRE